MMRDNRRPSWSHYPDGWTWRDASWEDRARAGLVVLAVILVALAGSVRL